MINTITFFLFNTYCRISIVKFDGDEEAVLNKAKESAYQVNRLLNVFDESSELAKVNRHYRVGEAIQLSSELFDFLYAVHQFSNQSDGIFDITYGEVSKLWDFFALSPKIPNDSMLKDIISNAGHDNVVFHQSTSEITILSDQLSFDPGGAGKGYAVDKAVESLVNNGVTSASIDYGGNLYVLGKNEIKNDPRDWKIAIQKPWSARGADSGCFCTSNKGISTSGAYDRFFVNDGKIYHHLLDFKTGYPVETSLQSATVIADNAFLADMLSTTIFLTGESMLDKLKSKFKFDYIIIQGDNVVTNIEVMEG